MAEQSPSSLVRTPSCFRRASCGRGSSKSDASSPLRLDSDPRDILATPGKSALSKNFSNLAYVTQSRYATRKACKSVDITTKPAASSRGGKRLRSTSAAAARKACLSGYLGDLPPELLEAVLRNCSPTELAALEATCSYFVKTGITESVARKKLKEIPRARGLRPEKRHRETDVLLLHFLNSQSQAAAQATAISFGAYHSVSLLVEGESRKCPKLSTDLDHSLYTFGRGFHGQLGQGNFETLSCPTRVGLSNGSSDGILPAVVMCGSNHSGSISRRGELFTWGLASSGELGHGGWTPIETNIPSQVLKLSKTRIVSITAGTNHTLAISEYGHLWTCGRGRHGQLGHGTFHDEGPLQCVKALMGCRIVSAAAGASHSLALASDGSLFSWGSGQYGQLGHKRMKQAAEAAQGIPVALPEPEKILELDPEGLRPPNRITAIAAGGQHSIALTVGGALLAFGRNRLGCLGLGDEVNRWVPTKVNLLCGMGSGASCRAVQVAAGMCHSIVLVQRNGCLDVRTTGGNCYGQLGHGDVRARSRFAVVAKLSDKQVISVSAGHEHSAAVNRDGKLFLWGRGELGQLGLGDLRSHWSPQLLRGFRVVHPDRTLRRNRARLSR